MNVHNAKMSDMKSLVELITHYGQAKRLLTLSTEAKAKVTLSERPN